MEKKALEQIIMLHAGWLESEGKYGERAIFENLDLRGISLDEFNLKRAKFRGVNLEKASFYRANLEGADLRNANLYKANLKESNFYEANLSDACLEDASLNLAVLRKSSLNNANLRNADLSGVDLHKADLTSADLSWTNLMDANMYRVKIENTVFDESILFRIKTDNRTASQLPLESLRRYGKTIFVESYEVKTRIVRSIEFPPEYHQAGMAILQMFGRAIKTKYPERKAKVRIEQDDLKVKMVVEPFEGETEIFEKALDEYGLVITGQISVEEYTSDRDLILELKNELRLAHARIEFQKDLIAYKNSDVDRLYRLLDSGIRNPPQISMVTSASAQLNSEIHVNFEIAPQIDMMHGILRELRDEVPTEETRTVRELQESLQEIENASSKQEVARSPAMSKFRRFLDTVDKADKTTGKVIQTANDGIDMARQLAGYYNEIAQWCGLPQVPKPFTK